VKSRNDQGIENDSTFYDGQPYLARHIGPIGKIDFDIPSFSIEFFGYRCYLCFEIVFERDAIMGTMQERQGSCACGAVHYVLKGEPLATAVCHCRHCQKQSGSAFSFNLIVKEADYAQSGETKSYVTIGDSGQPSYRHFCPQCGSPIITKAAVMPGVVIVKAGTLDSMEGLQPQREIYTDHAADWLDPVEGAALYARSP
jgi:hypothetical protein